MRALIADDDPVTAALLAGSLRRWQLEPIVTHDGKAAWEKLCEPDARSHVRTNGLRACVSSAGRA